MSKKHKKRARHHPSSRPFTPTIPTLEQPQAVSIAAEQAPVVALAPSPHVRELRMIAAIFAVLIILLILITLIGKRTSYLSNLSTYLSQTLHIEE